MNRKLITLLISFFIIQSTQLVYSEKADSSRATANSTSKFATQLTAPEDGWKRIDDTHDYINYIGDWKSESSDSYYSDNAKFSFNSENMINFNFSGSKLRIIGSTSDTLTNYQMSGARIIIDGSIIKTIDCRDKVFPITTPYGTGNQIVIFEALNLENKAHSVKIEILDKSVFTSARTCFILDAIDIDQDKQILPYDPASIKFIENKTTFTLGETSKLLLSFNPPTLSGHPQIWTSSNPTVVSVDEYGNISALSQGSATITVSIDGKPNLTDSCLIDIIPSKFSEYTLIINFKNGTVKEYNLTSSQIELFLKWFEIADQKLGKQFFCIDKKVNHAPYISRKEYITFDNIMTFELFEYNTKNN